MDDARGMTGFIMAHGWWMMILDDWPIMKATKMNDDCAMLELVYAKKAIWDPEALLRCRLIMVGTEALLQSRRWLKKRCAKWRHETPLLLCSEKWLTSPRLFCFFWKFLELSSGWCFLNRVSPHFIGTASTNHKEHPIQRPCRYRIAG